MSSTNMYQGLDTEARPSSRVLQPPGGGSSDLFGGYEDEAVASRKPNKMASKIFAPPEQAQNVPRRSNPPGGKSSGIFGESAPPAQQQRTMPPGGPTSNIFGVAESSAAQSPSRNHPNKPKDNLTLGPGPEPESPAPQAKVSQPEVKEEAAPPAPMPAKEEPTTVSAPPEPEQPSSSPPEKARNQEAELKNHEPHLGPRHRSHNRVLNPPGGKSSVMFY